MKHCSDLNILVSGMARLGWRLEKVTTLPRLLLLLSPGPHSDLTIPPMLTRMLQLVLIDDTEVYTEVYTDVDTDVDLLLLLLPPCPQSALHCPVSPRCRPAPAIASRRYLKLGVFVFVATNNFPSKSEKMDIC